MHKGQYPVNILEVYTNFKEQTRFLWSKKDGKDQETIQSSATADPGYHIGK